VDNDIREMLSERANDIPSLPPMPLATVRRVKRRRVLNGATVFAVVALIVAGAIGVGSFLRTNRVEPIVRPGLVKQLPVSPYATDIEPGFGRTWVYAGNSIYVEDPQLWGPPLKRITLGLPNRPGELNQDHLLAMGEGSVWALAGEEFSLIFAHQPVPVNPSDGGWSLVRIDPSTMEVKSVTGVGGTSPAEIAAGAGGVWVPDNGPKGHFVCRFDTTGKLVAKIKTPALTLDVTISDGAAWVLIDDHSSGTASLLRIDPKTNKIVRTIPVAGPSLNGSALTNGIAATENAVWIARQTGDGDEVVRIDTGSDRIVASVLVRDELRDLGSGGGRVWISLAKRSGIAWIDPATNGLAGMVPLSRDAQQMAAGDGFVWVTPNEGLDYIWRVTL
jgi:DNA-binding beta-propeller fold protein YncE